MLVLQFCSTGTISLQRLRVGEATFSAKQLIKSSASAISQQIMFAALAVAETFTSVMSPSMTLSMTWRADEVEDAREIGQGVPDR